MKLFIKRYKPIIKFYKSDISFIPAGTIIKDNEPIEKNYQSLYFKETYQKSPRIILTN